MRDRAVVTRTELNVDLAVVDAHFKADRIGAVALLKEETDAREVAALGVLAHLEGEHGIHERLVGDRHDGVAGVGEVAVFAIGVGVVDGRTRPISEQRLRERVVAERHVDGRLFCIDAQQHARVEVLRLPFHALDGRRVGAGQHVRLRHAVLADGHIVILQARELELGACGRHRCDAEAGELDVERIFHRLGRVVHELHFHLEVFGDFARGNGEGAVADGGSFFDILHAVDLHRLDGVRLVRIGEEGDGVVRDRLIVAEALHHVAALVLHFDVDVVGFQPVAVEVVPAVEVAPRAVVELRAEHPPPAVDVAVRARIVIRRDGRKVHAHVALPDELRRAFAADLVEIPPRDEQFHGVLRRALLTFVDELTDLTVGLHAELRHDVVGGGKGIPVAAPVVLFEHHAAVGAEVDLADVLVLDVLPLRHRKIELRDTVLGARTVGVDVELLALRRHIFDGDVHPLRSVVRGHADLCSLFDLGFGGVVIEEFVHLLHLYGAQPRLFRIDRFVEDAVDLEPFVGICHLGLVVLKRIIGNFRFILRGLFVARRCADRSEHAGKAQGEHDPFTFHTFPSLSYFARTRISEMPTSSCPSGTSTVTRTFTMSASS